MDKKLNLYRQATPPAKIFLVAMLCYCIGLLFLLAPPEERLSAVIIAIGFIILVLAIKSLFILYSIKKSPFKFLILGNDKVTLINNNKSSKSFEWSAITTISVNYDSSFPALELRKFSYPKYQIIIKTTDKSIKFYSFVHLSAFEFVKTALSKNIQISYNTTDTQKYFEKKISQI